MTEKISFALSSLPTLQFLGPRFPWLKCHPPPLPRPRTHLFLSIQSPKAGGGETSLEAREGRSGSPLRVSRSRPSGQFPSDF